MHVCCMQERHSCWLCWFTIATVRRNDSLNSGPKPLTNYFENLPSLIRKYFLTVTARSELTKNPKRVTTKTATGAEKGKRDQSSRFIWTVDIYFSKTAVSFYKKKKPHV